jgi:hypothetical protein
MLDKFLKGLAPVVAIALGSMSAGCDGVNINIGDTNGVPLAELDMSGDAPNSVAMAGPDSVVITEGDTLNIDVEGSDEAAGALRFSLDGSTLGISREGNFMSTSDKATIRVTMPAPAELVLAGSGTIAAEAMADKAEATIAGSGRIDVAALDSDSLELNVMGSGVMGAAGSAEKLDLNIAGSGRAELDELQVGSAEISIAGSGTGAFASDGEVDASIMGSGDVTVYGRASCTVSAMGSGKVHCKPADTDKAEGAEDEGG